MGSVDRERASRAAHWIVAAVLGVCSLTSAAAASFVAQWTKQSTLDYFPNGPGPRSWTNMVHNPVTGKMLLFGGVTSTYHWDVWEYDIATSAWRAIELPSNNCPGFFGFDGPDGRDAHTVAFDPYNNLLWTVGGSGYKCANNTPLAGTSTRTITSTPNTSTIVDTSLPSTLPVDHYRHWSVIANNKMVYISGYNPSTQTLSLATPIAGLAAGMRYELRVYTDSTTWYYSPATRTWRSMDGPYWGYTGPNPNRLWGRLAAAFAYSSADRAMVLFGGSVNGNTTNETWALNLTDTSQPGHPAVWVQKMPDNELSTTQPPGRNEISGAMVYDSRNDVFVLFGGRCRDALCPAVAAGDTWLYKLSTNQWTRRTPPVTPPGRMGHQMYYDSVNGVVVMWGGTNVDYYASSIPQGNYLQDLWVYDVASDTWTEVTPPAVAPVGRIIGSLTYDPVAQAAVLYGGAKYPFTLDFDVWKLVLTRQGGTSNQAPTAAIQTTPASGTTETTFSFSGAGSNDPDGTITSYAWTFGDGTTASGVAATHRYISSGSFTARLTVTDNAGASSSASSTVTVAAVNQPPVAAIQVSPGGGTTDTTFSFSGAGSSDSDGTISSYAWTFGDGATASGVSAAYRYAAPGTYTVRLTVTDNAGASSSSSTTVTVAAVNQAPVAAMQVTPGSGTTDTTFSFSGTNSRDSDGTIVSYAWRFGDGATASGSAVSYRYAAAGSYIAQLTVTDNGGASSTSSANVIVSPGNQAPVAVLTLSPTSGVVGTVFAMSGSASSDRDGSVTSYAWDFGDGTNATGVSTSHAYAAQGNYVVTLRVTDNAGAVGTASATVVVKKGKGGPQR